MLDRLSLRARLLLGVVVLGAVGLIVADVATYASLRSFLIDRTDESLAEAQRGLRRPFGGLHCDGGGRAPPGLAPGDVVQIRSGGDVVCSLQVTGFSDSSLPPPPVLPDTIEAGSFTVSAREGDERYRVRAAADPRSGETLVVATPLDDVDATLRRLLLIMVLVTVAVLAALAGLALWVVRLGLRPLDAIGATAGAIAGGDLSRRVERAEPHTEVGRLGLALNSMLGQIEAAFTAQEASERRLRRFVADASHELRTPLAAVRAYAELFGRGSETRPEDLSRSMTGIRRESERMSLLVDDLLLLARLDEGRPLEREPVALADVVGEAVETARTVEPDRPVELEAESAEVLGDRERLRQIVDNLLANVRAHTQPGAPVSVSVRRVGGAAVIAVADSGPGLDGDEAERVFERFYRTDGSRTRASGGVGLGLSIVAAVARAHGGSAAARSDPGSGATFLISLPLAPTTTNGGSP